MSGTPAPLTFMSLHLSDGIYHTDSGPTKSKYFEELKYYSSPSGLFVFNFQLLLKPQIEITESFLSNPV